MAPSRRQHATDRGWAWVVLAAAMGSNVLNGALVYLVGVVHTGLLDMFQPDTVTFLALTGAVYIALSSLAAPLASYIINRFGCRTCCVLGGVFCFVGYTSSAFVTSMYQLFFTFGITAGLGLGFVYSANNITIGFYFDRLRAVVAGISNSFQAVGILTGPIVYQAIEDAYNTRGAFLLLGAISLHFSFFGMFFRPTIYEGKDRVIVVTEPDKEIENMETKVPGTVHQEAVGSSEQKLTGEGTVSNTDTDIMDNRAPMLKHIESGKDNTETHSTITTSLVGEKADGATDDETVVHDAKEATLCGEVDGINTTAVVTDMVDVKDCISQKLNKYEIDNCNVPLLGKDDGKRLKNEDTRSVYITHDTDSLAFDTVPSKTCGNDCILSPTTEKTSHHHGCEDGSRIARLSSCSRKTSFFNPGSEPCHPDRKGKSEMTWLRRFMSSPYVQILDKAFLLHCGALFASNAHSAGICFHLPEYAKLHGTGPIQRAELFLGIGAFSLLSKLISGLATSDPCIDPLILSVGMMGLNGVITCFFPLFADTFFKQMLFSSVFGLYFGGVFALMTPLLVRFVGVERLAHAYGIIMFCVGIGFIAGPAVPAMIVDAGGTYSHGFVLLGLICLCGSFFDMGAACFLQSRNKAPEISPDTGTNGCGDGDVSRSP